jgi:hypothetical protein
MTRREKPRNEIPVGYVEKFVSFITTSNGKRLYAKAYGKRAWRILVKA